MKRYIFNTLMCGALALGSFSCTDKYIDINSDPYQPGDLNPDDYALGSAMSNLAGTVISDDNNTAQFTDCLLGGTCGGYFADSGAWPSSIGNFNATNDWTRVFLISDRIIPQLYPNLNTVKLVSQTTENPVPYAIAMVIKVAAMSRVTDAYGAIPYSQIGEEGKITVPYDSQEKVYDTFFNELDSAIVTLTENKDAALVPSAAIETQGLGHTFITTGNGDNTTVYTYGRYGAVYKDKSSANSTSPIGEGVLIIYKGTEAKEFIKDQINNRKASAFEFANGSDSKVDRFFQDKFNQSDKIPSGNKIKNKSNARVIDEYNLLNNNCTTLSIEAIEKGGGDVSFLKGEIAPFKALQGASKAIIWDNIRALFGNERKIISLSPEKILNEFKTE